MMERQNTTTAELDDSQVEMAVPRCHNNAPEAVQKGGASHMAAAAAQEEKDTLAKAGQVRADVVQNRLPVRSVRFWVGARVLTGAAKHHRVYRLREQPRLRH